MKRFDRLRTILWIIIFVFCILATGYDNIFANVKLDVKLKDEKMIFVNETITTDMFEFQLGNKSICDLENVEMSPHSFSNAGEQSIIFTYKDDNVAYMKKVTVNVQPVEALFLSGGKDTISLIQGQEVTRKHLPEVYLHYNNGEREQILDYSFTVDWEMKKVSISYDCFSFELAIDVIENEMDYLEIKPYVKEVPENYVFDMTDIVVILHYTNGTKETVTDYQILPYKLVEGCESLVYVTYKEMMGSFKVEAEKVEVEAIPLPTEPPVILLPDLTLPAPQPTAIVEDREEISETAGPHIMEETSMPEPEQSGMYEETSTPEPEQSGMCEGTSTVEPEQTIMPEESVTEHTKTEPEQVASTFEPEQKDTWKENEKDTTPPKTNIQEKTYTKNIEICATDESEIASVVLRGSINKTIKNGYKLTKEGSYQLILTDVYGNAKTVKFKLEKPVKKIKVSYSFTDKWNVMKFQAKATGTSRGVKWSVSNKKIATVDKNGTFKVKKSGTVYLIAKLDKKKVQQKIKIEKKKKSILLY